MTYRQVTRLRQDDEACLQEVEAQSYSRVTRRATEPAFVRAARESLEEMLAYVDDVDKERLERLGANRITDAARARNSDAWVSNLKLRKPGDSLAPFVTEEGEVIAGFPETVVGILLLDEESLRSLLCRLDLDDAGAKAQMVWRLANHIGVDIWMKDFLKYHLGEECNALSMASLAIPLDHQSEWEDNRDSADMLDSS